MFCIKLVYNYYKIVLTWYSCYQIAMVPGARELERKLLDFLQNAKQEARDEDAFQVAVSRQVQRSSEANGII